jgi:HlyD family secretion protein
MNPDLSAETTDKESVVGKDDKALDQRPFAYFRKHRQTTILLLLLLLLAAGYAAYHLYSTNSEQSNMVQVSGRIEAVETHISAGIATRVTSVLVKEGDQVHKGQLIVTLDSGSLQKSLGASGPALKAALSARRATNAQVAAVRQEIGVARAKSHGFLAKIFSTKGGRAKKEQQMRTEMLQAQMMSMQARSAVASVEGAREQASSKLSYFNITSPIDGVCTIKSTEPGELVAAGQVLLTLADLNSAYLRGFVPQADIARIKVGQTAQVFLDADPKNALSGTVTSIDAAPSFTPENIYFKNDRLRQAFGIKISIDHPNGLVKPGMSAEAKIVFN